ncbi:MAG TPA: NAD-dependent epimerase/dehydratase family protein [Candidatus Solibacter sp.]|jgi:nucleoside-diphosphate-sugar epimerase|nr:NAD-dependent epimerase/dehydratase family protein [Candidatus Solibacter sp.]
MKVFVTGATGFIGSEVARRLRQRGDDVVALVRDRSGAGGLEEIGCQLVEGDLDSAGAIAGGMRGCDAAIHLAAMYEVGIPKSRRPAMYAANVEGTRTILGTALELEIPKVVYVSTVNAFGNTEGQVVDETHQHTERYVSYYDETKHLAHKLAREMIDKGLRLVIVQPGGVYGPGDTSPQGRLITQFLDGKLPAMMFPDTGINMVHRDDVADGILLALDKGKPGEAYVLGGQITTMGEAIRTLGKVAGRKPPRITVPTAVIKAVAPLGPVIGPALGQGPNLHEIISAVDGVTYWAKDDKARRELGYSPRGLEQGMRDMLEVEGRLPEQARGKS